MADELSKITFNFFIFATLKYASFKFMIMKYLKFFASILILCLVMTACTKEGQ